MILYLLVPFAMVAAFAAKVYFYMHHIGVLFLLLVFYLWISWKAENCPDEKHPNLRKFFRTWILVAIIINITWTVNASFKDIQSNYSIAREASSFIKDHRLEDYHWGTTFMVDLDPEDQHIIRYNPYETSVYPVVVNPYFDRPILGERFGGTSYINHRVATAQEAEREIKEIIETGIDFALDIPSGSVRGVLNLADQYDFAACITFNRTWKGKNTIIDCFIVGKKEIIDRMRQEGEIDYVFQ